MEIYRDEKCLYVTCAPLEGSLLSRIFDTIRANYQIRPSDLDAKAASAWYSTRGCQTAGMSPAETRDWIEILFRNRSENGRALTAWIWQLRQKHKQGHQLQIPLDEASRFLGVLNDHRLFQAARHDLGEEEMRKGSSATFQALTPEQQAAFCEVELLGYLMESVLACLPNSGSDWRNICIDPETPH